MRTRTKATILVVLAFLVVAVIMAVSPAAAWTGCTPGYWKNHTDNWPMGYTVTTTVQSVFPGTLVYTDTTLIEALQFKGGRGVDGAQRILLRRTVAHFLTLQSTNPQILPGFIAYVEGALNSNDRQQIIDAAEFIEFGVETGDPCPY